MRQRHTIFVETHLKNYIILQNSERRSREIFVETYWKKITKGAEHRNICSGNAM